MEEVDKLITVLAEGIKDQIVNTGCTDFDLEEINALAALITARACYGSVTLRFSCRDDL